MVIIKAFALSKKEIASLKNRGSVYFYFVFQIVAVLALIVSLKMYSVTNNPERLIRSGMFFGLPKQIPIGIVGENIGLFEHSTLFKIVNVSIDQGKEKLLTKEIFALIVLNKHNNRYFMEITLDKEDIRSMYIVNLIKKEILLLKSSLVETKLETLYGNVPKADISIPWRRESRVFQLYSVLFPFILFFTSFSSAYLVMESVIADIDAEFIDSLFILPIKEWEIITGKLIPYIFFGLLQFGIALFLISARAPVYNYTSLWTICLILILLNSVISLIFALAFCDAQKSQIAFVVLVAIESIIFAVPNKLFSEKINLVYTIAQLSSNKLAPFPIFLISLLCAFLLAVSLFSIEYVKRRRHEWI